MSTERYLVLSAIGPDRPGLVAEVTDYLTSRGVNIEDSKMAIFGAEFGILVLVSGPETSISTVQSDREMLEQKTKLLVVLRPTKSPEEHRRAAVIPCVVTADALDHEGIVRAVAVAIARMGINIVSLETASYNAPVTGSPLFRLEAHVDLPPGISLAQLRAQMAEVARVENLDIDVRSLV